MFWFFPPFFGFYDLYRRDCTNAFTGQAAHLFSPIKSASWCHATMILTQ